jgi:hypothetical protein
VTPEELSARLRPALTSAGYEVEDVTLPSGWALGGRRRDFRMRWVATQLKTSVFATTVPFADGDTAARFARESFHLAALVKGGLPNGLQSGIGCVAVLVADDADGHAWAFAQSKPTREWFTGISTYALVTPRGVSTYNGSVAVGRIYVPFLREQRDLAVAAVLGQAR